MNDKADLIIEKYYAAVGGYGNIKNLQLKYTKGQYTEGDFSLVAEFYWKSPNIRRMKWQSGEIIGGEGYDGQQSWEINHRSGKAEILEGAKADAARRGAVFEEAFIDYQKKGNSIVSIREEILLGESVTALEIQVATDWKKTYYFLNNGLLRAISREMPLHGEGEDIDLLSVHDDFQQVQGITVHTTFREINKTTGEIIATGTVDEIRFNELVQATDHDFLAPNLLISENTM